MIILFFAVMILIIVLVAKNLSAGNDISDISDFSGTSDISDINDLSDHSEANNSSEELSEYSQPVTESSGEKSEEYSQQSDESSDSSAEEYSEESTENSKDEASDEISDEASDKLSKKEQPVYIQKQEGVKYIAFTFDDGPSPNTADLLDFIEEKGIPVTFFSVGQFLENETYGGYIRRAVSLGCEIGIHAYTHEYYFHNCSDEIYFSELSKTEELIYKYSGYYPILMRPPGGSITEKRAAESEYNVIIWSVDSEDWKYKDRSTSAIAQQNIQIIADNIISRVHSTSQEPIVLMHDLYKNSIEAFKIAAEQLLAEGYQFVTVAQLCELDATTTVGKRYWSPTYLK